MSSSDTTPPLKSPTCAVCATPAGQRCSNCQSVFFCSSGCAELLWPVHKPVCFHGADGAACYMAALSREESNHLHRIPKELYEVPLALFEASAMWKKGWSSLIDELSLERGPLLAEPARSHVLAFVRSWPYYGLTISIPTSKYPFHMPYVNLGGFHEELHPMHGMVSDKSRTKVDLFRQLNNLYRAILALDALSQQTRLSAKSRPAALTSSVIEKAIKHVQEEVEQAVLTPAQREKARSCLKPGIEEAREGIKRLSA
ncbi:hypothetical protein JCM6882_006873 [Rhodosporidiobolus microsporus]